MKRIFALPIVLFLLSCSSPRTALDYCKKADKQSRKLDSKSEAKDNYLNALKLDSTCIAAYDGLGRLLMDSPDEKELQEAKKYFDRCIQINPGFAAAWYHKGLTFAREKNFSEAILAYDKALHLDRGNADYFYSRAVAFINSGNPQKGYEDFRRACEFGNMEACRILKSVSK
jgi:tetratricopeptide (TPR) repeat protein